jgi:hypothetical protein
VSDLQVPESLQDAQHSFQDSVRRYEAEAGRWKRWHRWSWLGNAMLTCLTQVIAVAGLALQRQDFADFTLYLLLPFLSFCGISFTAFQLLVAPQNRWLSYRAAVQKLWRLAVYYRAGLFPFTDPRDVRLLKQKLQDICEPLEQRCRESWKETCNRLLRDYKLLEVPGGSYPELPREGLRPPLSDGQAYLDGRLRHQRQWYLAKARRYQCEYYAFMASIGLIYTFNFAWSLFAGRAFWLIAGTTAVTLMLFAILDFLNRGPLWVQYRQAASDLDAIEKAYEASDRPFDLLDQQRRAQRLVEHVEQALWREFHWFAIQQRQRPKSDPDLHAGEAYRPQPIPTGNVALPSELEELREVLARNAHEVWAERRLEEGWRLGAPRDEIRKLTPCLIAYEKLPESEKDYDRSTAMETLKTIVALGYRIEKT